MKKYLILILVPAFFACSQGGEKKTALADSLSTINENIKNELAVKEELLSSKEVAMNEFIKSFNEIQANLNEIKEKQKIISTKSEGVEFKNNNKDQIISDIQSIYDLLDKNKKQASNLSKKLKNSNLQADEIRLAVSNLTNQVNDKENEITKLKSNLEKLHIDFANLKIRYYDEVEESNMKTEKLNTAYYLIGSNKDLTEKGVITKSGGFIGLGKVAQLNQSLNKNYFTKIDVTQTSEIPIHGDKVKLVSIHPADSYKLIEGSASIDKIVILNQEKFWSVSKYLIIASEKKKSKK
jgi:flagellar biosynthesis GTPase FlhF